MIYHSIKPESINTLPAFKLQLEKCKEECLYSRIKFLRPYCVSYLDQLFLVNQERNNILFLPEDRKVHKYLSQCGFEFLHTKSPDIEGFNEKHIIKLKRFNGTESVIESLAVEWIETSIFPYITVDNALEKKIVRNIWEIIQNAIVHSENKHGISACGQFYPLKNYFEIAFCDFGIGIPKKIKSFAELNNLNNDSDYIEWSLGKGNSTLNKPNAGMGLYFLRQFIKINQGNFQIISGNGFFGHINSPVEEKVSLSNIIDGTLVNIRINYIN